VVGVALVVASLAPVAAPAGAAPEDTLADKVETARQLERDLAENGLRISRLAEDYDLAVVRIEEISAGIVDAHARLDRARARSDQIRGVVETRAASLYKRAGSSVPFDEFDVADVREVGTREKYSAAAAARDDDLLDELGVARELIEERQAALEEQRRAALAEQARLEAARSEIEAAHDEQEGLLAQVKGEIAELVQKEQERREREAEAQARAELERRLAAERAARERDRGLAPPDVPAPSPKAQIAVDTATAQIGKPYRYAAAGPDEFDCSGLTRYAWAAAGVSLAHSSRAQYASLPHVPMDALAPGDLVFYGSPIHHVGVYLGDGLYVHAPQTGEVVKVSSIYRSDWAGAGRPG
jgi:cell wall-associated NlpC family hydrolase